MRLKQLILLLGATASLSIMGISVSRADQIDVPYLIQIVNNTNEIKNNTMATLTALNKYISAWIDPWKAEDKAAPSLQTMQESFSQLGKLISENPTNQLGKSQGLNSGLLTGAGNNLYSNAPLTPTSAPIYANDLVYSTILGSPFYPKEDPRKAKNPSIDPLANYIKNAGGLFLNHALPNPGGRGTAAAKDRYQKYYNTAIAVESFNGFVLSNQITDGNQLNTLQTKLVTQASDPAEWFAKLATESIGIVLRQILLYQSQCFVLLTQLVQTQKQMVTAQVMTNALLLTINQTNETLLVSSAEGTPVQAP